MRASLTPHPPAASRRPWPRPSTPRCASGKRRQWAARGPAARQLAPRAPRGRSALFWPCRSATLDCWASWGEEHPRMRLQGPRPRIARARLGRPPRLRLPLRTSTTKRCYRRTGQVLRPCWHSNTPGSMGRKGSCSESAATTTAENAAQGCDWTSTGPRILRRTDAMARIAEQSSGSACKRAGRRLCTSAVWSTLHRSPSVELGMETRSNEE